MNTISVPPELLSLPNHLVLAVVSVVCALVGAFRYHDVCRPLPAPPRRTRVAGLRTGDVLLWTGARSARLVAERFLIGPFTHVGLVVRCRDRSGAIVTLVWESMPDCGKRLAPVETLLRRARRAQEQIWARKLGFRGRRVEDGDISTQLLADLVRRGLGTAYGFSFWRVAFQRWCAHLPLPVHHTRQNITVTQPLFCSELVAFTLCMLGILHPHDTQTFDFLPADFSSAAPRRPLPLAPGFQFGPDTLLVG